MHWRPRRSQLCIQTLFRGPRDPGRSAMTVTKYSGNTKAIVVGALTAAILDFAILRRWGLDRRAENPVANVTGRGIGR
jgi:hypothetical protein